MTSLHWCHETWISNRIMTVGMILHRLKHPLGLQYFFVAKEKNGVALVQLSMLSFLEKTFPSLMYVPLLEWLLLVKQAQVLTQ